MNDKILKMMSEKKRCDACDACDIVDVIKKHLIEEIGHYKAEVEKMHYSFNDMFKDYIIDFNAEIDRLTQQLESFSKYY